jgi:hypothetical protein
MENHSGRFSEVFNHVQPKEMQPALIAYTVYFSLVFVITRYPQLLSHCQHINFSSYQKGIKYSEK